MPYDHGVDLFDPRSGIVRVVERNNAKVGELARTISAKDFEFQAQKHSILALYAEKLLPKLIGTIIYAVNKYTYVFCILCYKLMKSFNKLGSATSDEMDGLFKTISSCLDGLADQFVERLLDRYCIQQQYRSETKLKIHNILKQAALQTQLLSGQENDGKARNATSSTDVEELVSGGQVADEQLLLIILNELQSQLGDPFDVKNQSPETVGAALNLMTLAQRQEFLKERYAGKTEWTDFRASLKRDPIPADLLRWFNNEFPDRKELGLVFSDLAGLDKPAYDKLANWVRRPPEGVSGDLRAQLGFPTKITRYDPSLEHGPVPSASEVYAAFRSGDAARGTILKRCHERHKKHAIDVT